jgi:hypothetical protein
MKFSVVSLPEVDDALADLWLKAPDPQAVTDAADWIERELANDPLSKVTRVDDTYFLRRDPLVVLCTINEEGRVVQLIEIHRINKA